MSAKAWRRGPTGATVRTCERCGAEVHELADIDGADDHHVLIEKPMRFGTDPENADFTGGSVKITVSQDIGMTTCATLRERYGDAWPPRHARS